MRTTSAERDPSLRYPPHRFALDPLHSSLKNFWCSGNKITAYWFQGRTWFVELLGLDRTSHLASLVSPAQHVEWGIGVLRDSQELHKIFGVSPRFCLPIHRDV